jgi:hypothetical protein
VTVDYATADGTAKTADGDYLALSGTATFQPGETSKTIDVTVVGDTKVEATELFAVNLTNPTGGVPIADGQGVGTITNDDSSSLPSITINDISATEGNSGQKAFNFTVKLSHTSGVPVTVHFGTHNGTAIAGSDYVGRNNTLTFSPGQLTKTLTVQVNGDHTNEANETFTMKLDSATNATIADGSGTATILNDDGGLPAINPNVSVNDVSITEGNSGTKLLVFTVKLSQATSKTVSVKYTTSDGTATLADGDYVGQTNVLTFAAGVTTRTVSVVIKGDTKHEANESLLLVLSQPTNCVITDNSGIGTILNDD